MSLSTKGLVIEEKKQFVNQFISYGVQDLRVNDITVDTASTGSKRITAHVEGRPIGGDFKGWEDAAGLVGKVKSGWLANNDQKLEFLQGMGKMADRLGCREELDNLSFAEDLSDFESYINSVTKLFRGKWLRYNICSEQYINKEGRVSNSLKFYRMTYDFCESTDIPLSQTKLKFDESKHYFVDKSKLVVADANPVEIESMDSLPF